MQPTGEHEYNHFAILRLGRSRKMHARNWLDSVEKAAIAGAQYFPGIDRRFRVVWRENISFEIARRTAATARKGMERHKYVLAGVEDDE